MAEKIPVKVFKLRPDAVVPAYQSEFAAGFDLSTIEDLVIPPGVTVLAKTGLKFEIPAGYQVEARPRSGLSLKTKLRIANSPGTIDADYRGEIGVILENIAPVSQSPSDYEAKTIRFKAGERVAQGVLMLAPQAQFVVVADESDLSSTTRGEGGYGSTGSRS